MDKNKIIEEHVSDTITQKPIHFSVKYTDKQPLKSAESGVEAATAVGVEKMPVCRFFPFITKRVKRENHAAKHPEPEDVESTDVEVEERFSIHPPTLGKMQILSKLYLQLDIDEHKFNDQPHKEVMRVCEDHADVVCRIMSVATFSSESDLLDDRKIEERANFFKWHCYPEDFCSCMLAILVQVDYSNFINSIRLTKMFRQNMPTIEGAVRVEQSGDAPSGEDY